MNVLTNDGANPASRGGEWAEATLAAWTVTMVTIMLWGYGLSAIGALASWPGWLVGLATAVGLALVAGRSVWRSGNRDGTREGGWATLCAAVREQPVLVVVGFGVAVATGAGFVTMVASAPSNWDSLTYHLARVGYYLQEGTLADYGANYYAQEQHARGMSIVQCAIVTLSGRSDLLVEVPQWLGYLMCMVGIFALGRETGRGRAAALTAAAAFGLLTIAAMEMPTAQNDLVLASLLGAGLVGAVRYLARGKRSALALAAGGVAAALAIKASALTCGLAFAVVLAVAVRRGSGPRGTRWRRVGTLALAMIGAALVLAGPAGYWKNLKRFGHPLGGPELVRHHTAPQGEEGGRWSMGGLNLVRFAGDFFTLDGVPEAWGGEWGARAKQKAGATLKAAGVDAESPRDTQAPFSWSRPRFADENLSFFGWAGVALLLPGCVGALGRARREPLTAALALGFILFFIGQAFAGPYDPWRGRHFLVGAVFAAPAAGWLFEAGSRGVRRAAWAAAAVAAVAIVPAVLWRSPNPLLPRPGVRTVFQLNRLEQMAVHHPSYPALSAFERLVPADATVVVAMPDNEYEYVLFGRSFSRRLIPYRRVREQPELAREADYLIYDGRIPLVRETTDVGLGYRWALRKLEPGAALREQR